MPIKEKEQKKEVESTKEMKRLLIRFRDSIEDYLDNIDMEADDDHEGGKKDKEKK